MKNSSSSLTINIHANLGYSNTCHYRTSVAAVLFACRFPARNTTTKKKKYMKDFKAATFQAQNWLKSRPNTLAFSLQKK